MTYIGWLITYVIFVFIYFFIGYHCFSLAVYHSVWFTLLGFAYPIILLVVLGVIFDILEKKGIIEPSTPNVPPNKEQSQLPTIFNESNGSIEHPQVSPTDGSPTQVEATLHDMPQAELQTSVPPVPLTPRQPTIDEMLSSVDCLDGPGFERWCARLLGKIGFTDVQLTKASGDQGVDILASKDDIWYAIQCKCYSSDIGNHPVQEVHAGKAMYNCHVGVVMTNRYFTPGAKDLAKATGTLLWDRDKLKAMIQELQKQNTPGEA